MLSEVKERLEGPKYNIDFGGRGWGRQGKGIAIPTMQKEAILRECLNTFVPHCSFIASAVYIMQTTSTKIEDLTKDDKLKMKSKSESIVPRGVQHARKTKILRFSRIC